MEIRSRSLRPMLAIPTSAGGGPLVRDDSAKPNITRMVLR